MAIKSRTFQGIGHLGGLSLVLLASCSGGADGVSGSEAKTSQSTAELSRSEPSAHLLGKASELRRPSPRRIRHRKSCPIGVGGGAPEGGEAGAAGEAPVETGGSAGIGAGGDTGSVSQCLPLGPGLIDDFEDGDILTDTSPLAAWFTANDATPGATQLPDPWLPTSGGADGSAYAACTSGTGFTSWGAILGATFLSPATHSGDQCVDLSTVKGIRFKARGSGPIHLSMPTIESTVPAFGGTCAGTACGYYPNIALSLSDDWQVFEIPWTALQPGASAFDPTQALGINFAAVNGVYPTPSDVTFDFCVDDIELF